MSGPDAAVAAIAAIDARVAELDEEQLENERGALLAELESGAAMTEALRGRVEAIAAADLARAERLPDGTWTAAARESLRALLDGSDVTDAVPVSMTVTAEGAVCVVSAARGQVAIGAWDAAAIARGEREELRRLRAELEAEASGMRGGLTRDRVVGAVVDGALAVASSTSLVRSVASSLPRYRRHGLPTQVHSNEPNASCRPPGVGGESRPRGELLGGLPCASDCSEPSTR
jgi:hypothetical protein